MNDLQKLAAYLVAREDASGEYDPEEAQKLANFVGGILGAGASGFASWLGGSASGKNNPFDPKGLDFDYTSLIAPVLSGYVSGDKHGVPGALGNAAAQYAIGRQMENSGSSMAGKYIRANFKNPAAQKAVWGLLQAGGGLGASTLVNQATKSVDDLYNDFD